MCPILVCWSSLQNLGSWHPLFWVVWQWFSNNLSHFWGFPGGTSCKEPTYQCRRHGRDVGSISELGRSGGGHGNPLQYSCLENPMDRGAWWATVHNIMTEATWHARTCTRALLSFLSITSFLEVQFFTECYFFPYSYFFFKINSISHSTFVLQEPFLLNRKLLSSISICSQMPIIFW